MDIFDSHGRVCIDPDALNALRATDLLAAERIDRVAAAAAVSAEATADVERVESQLKQAIRDQQDAEAALRTLKPVTSLEEWRRSRGPAQ